MVLGRRINFEILGAKGLNYGCLVTKVAVIPSSRNAPPPPPPVKKIML